MQILQIPYQHISPAIEYGAAVRMVLEIPKHAKMYFHMNFAAVFSWEAPGKPHFMATPDQPTTPNCPGIDWTWAHCPFQIVFTAAPLSKDPRTYMIVVHTSSDKMGGTSMSYSVCKIEGCNICRGTKPAPIFHPWERWLQRKSQSLVVIHGTFNLRKVPSMLRSGDTTP